MISVDSRFGSGRNRSHETVARLVGERLQVYPTLLEFGDFMFYGHGPEDVIRVGIELKTVNDFISSMQSGRLGEQLTGMLETYDRSYLIIEGFYKRERTSGLLEVPGRVNASLGRPVFWNDIERYLTSIEESGIRVRHTGSSRQTAQVISQVLVPFWDKPYDEHRSLKTIKPVSLPMSLVREDAATSRMRRVCVGLQTGIGYGRSKAVVEHFRSIQNMVNADAKAWEGIAGVGRGIVAGTMKAFCEETGQTKQTRATSAGRVKTRARAGARSTRHTRAR